MKISAKLKKITLVISNNDVISKTIKNSSWIISEKVLSLLIGVIITALLARYFGPEKYGLFNYALSFTALFTVISTLGLETLSVKEILDEKFDEGTILCTSLYLRIVGGVILTTIAAILIRLIEPNNSSLHLLVLIMSFTMIFKAFEVIEYWIQANQKAKITSVIRIIVFVISSIMKILLIILGGTLTHFALIYLIDIIIIGIALNISYKKFSNNDSTWKLSFIYAKNILKKSKYLILSGLLVTLYMRIDQIMLGIMMPTTAELGVYSVAVRLSTMWFFVPTAIITSFTPIIMKNKKKDNITYLSSIQLLYSIITWLGISFGILILIFSNPIVSILFGEEYIEAAAILSISIWGGVFAMLGSARASWLITEGLQKFSIIYIGSGALINLVLNFILIPIYGGYGAAIATLISQISVSIVVPFFIKKTRVSSIMMIKAFNIKNLLNLDNWK